MTLLVAHRGIRLIEFAAKGQPFAIILRRLLPLLMETFPQHYQRLMKVLLPNFETSSIAPHDIICVCSCAAGNFARSYREEVALPPGVHCLAACSGIQGRRRACTS